ncbi:MAG: Cof-type HAD-IIB family hydrolase [Desulfitobacterium hafniense]|nr:Cof-type HAD-IIB family hydrolase [Desulfitobacterium hafniense]
MAIRLIAMDLDDTLLLDDWTISPRVQKAIRLAREQGVKITIATGRMPNSAKPYAEQLGIDIPFITYHGAFIQQAISGEVLFRKVIPSSLAKKIITPLLERGVHTQLYLKERVMTQIMNDWAEEYSKLAGIQVEQTDLLRVLDNEEEGAEKILFMAEESQLAKLWVEIREKYAGSVHVTASKRHFLELVNVSVNKGVALKALAERYNIPSEEVMAIGDSLNDIEMVKFAGLGVAMGNARPELKQVADVITSSNQEDGVAEAIERFVLSKE